MPSIILQCPHCGAEKVGFSIVAEHIGVVPPQDLMHGSKRHRALMICSKCEGGLVGVFDRNAASGAPQTLQGCGTDPTILGYRLTETYPLPAPTKIPDHVTPPLDRFYQQAADALKRSDWDASGAMSRKVIDVSTKMQLGPVEEKKYNNNRQRIDALATSGSITSDMKDWAHVVRVGGNEAVHDDDPFKQEEAEDLLNFTELYLIYVYTLPGRLKARRERREEMAPTTVADAGSPPLVS